MEIESSILKSLADVTLSTSQERSDTKYLYATYLIYKELDKLANEEEDEKIKEGLRFRANQWQMFYESKDLGGASGFPRRIEYLVGQMCEIYGIAMVTTCAYGEDYDDGSDQKVAIVQIYNDFVNCKSKEKPNRVKEASYAGCANKKGAIRGITIEGFAEGDPKLLFHAIPSSLITKKDGSRVNYIKIPFGTNSNISRNQISTSKYSKTQCTFKEMCLLTEKEMEERIQEKVSIPL